MVFKEVMSMEVPEVNNVDREVVRSIPINNPPAGSASPNMEVSFWVSLETTSILAMVLRTPLQ